MFRYLIEMMLILIGPPSIDQQIIRTKKQFFPKKKRDLAAYGYYDQKLKVKWRDSDTRTTYEISPRQDSNFHDSIFLYVIINYLQANPDGFCMKISNTTFYVFPTGTDKNLVPKLETSISFSDF